MDIQLKLAETEEEIAKIVEYGRNFWVQTRYSKQGVEYDVETVTNVTRHLSESGVAMYAETPDGETVGLMLVAVAPFPMNANVLQACEWVFYVDPKYRTGGLGAHMLQQATALLRNMGIKFFTMVSLANVTPEAANRLYEKLGFEHSETSFTKDLQGPQE